MNVTMKLKPQIKLQVSCNVQKPMPEQSEGGGTAVATIHTYSTTPTITGREIVTEEV